MACKGPQRGPLPVRRRGRSLEAEMRRVPETVKELRIEVEEMINSRISKFFNLVEEEKEEGEKKEERKDKEVKKKKMEEKAREEKGGSKKEGKGKGKEGKKE